MKILASFILLSILTVPSLSFSFDISAFPKLIGNDTALARTDEIFTWNPDNMFEHVNGEAELLKRFGVVSLTFVSYESDDGDYVSIDMFDLGIPINAYGLYRLYAGCDGQEYTVLNATVLFDEYTQYVLLGQYFLRINLDISNDAAAGNDLVNEFLKHLSNNFDQQFVLPSTLTFLKRIAITPCEVNYHPEHIDYEVESGPGYSWIGQDGNTYFLATLDSQTSAKNYVGSLKDKGIIAILNRQNVVIWKKNDGEGTTDYMQEILKGLGDES